MGKTQNQGGLLETMEENQNKVPNAESTAENHTVIGITDESMSSAF